MKRLLAFATLQMILAEATFAEGGSKGVSANQIPETTYESFLPLAEAGDPRIQHFLGFMFFYGDGVEQDYDEAHYWYHRAAEEGDFKAQRNLGIFHSRSLPHVPEKYYVPEEANLWFSLAAASSQDPQISKLASRSYSKFLTADTEKLLKETEKRHIGETIYVTYCAGCHGFNGHASYPGAPSFALGQRLKQSDRVLADSILNGTGLMPAWGSTLSKELADSIRNGLGSMPSWENMLLPHQIDTLVKFIRTLPKTYESGIGNELRPPPELFFRFRPRGETGPEWIGTDPRANQ